MTAATDTDAPPRATRRAVLAAAGTALAASVAPTTASAQTTEEWRDKPDHVTLEYDQTVLERYQPKLVKDRETREQYRGMYGYVARSDERDSFVCCYWSQLTHQDGLPFVNKDTHHRDHEPAYVFVDATTGDVSRVVFTNYHWFGRDLPAYDAHLTAAREDYETHVNLRVDPTYHHYYHSPDQEGAFTDVLDWLSVRDDWIDIGWYEPVHAPAVENPWTMLSRATWWADGTWDARMAAVWVHVGLRTGAFGAEDVDHVRT